MYHVCRVVVALHVLLLRRFFVPHSSFIRWVRNNHTSIGSGTGHSSAADGDATDGDTSGLYFGRLNQYFFDSGM
jgi:hypothetical protein